MSRSKVTSMPVTAVFSARFWPLVWGITSPLASSAAVLITCGPGTISGSVVWLKGATNGVLPLAGMGIE